MADDLPFARERGPLLALHSVALLDSFRTCTRQTFSNPSRRTWGPNPRFLFRPNLGRSKYMEQRRLRLGDILDDYCPRERRVTNHAVVAMIGEDVKQTRCTTCDAEHAFKGAREPRRRKKDSQAVLYREVLAGLPDAELAVAGALPVDAVALVAPAT